MAPRFCTGCFDHEATEGTGGLCYDCDAARSARSTPPTHKETNMASEQDKTNEHHPYESIALVDLSSTFAQHWFGTGKNYDAALDGTLTACDRVDRSVAHTVICLDRPPYFRKDMYAGYKAKRPSRTPEQIACYKEVLARLEERGFRAAHAPGYEADDIIAGLAAVFRLVCDDVRIVGRDKDLLQLVNGKVRLFVPAQGDDPETLVDGPACFGKLGVAPSQVCDWLALTGDDSDNIPGCPKVGPKTATDIITTYGSLNALYTRLAAEPATVQEYLGKVVTWNLKEFEKQVRLARTLVELRIDAPVDANDLLRKGVRKAMVSAYTAPVPGAADEADALDQALETFAPEAPASETKATLGVLTAAEHDAARHQHAGEAPRPIIGADPNAAEVLRAAAAERGQVYPNPLGKPEAELLDPAVAIPAPTRPVEVLSPAATKARVEAAHAVAAEPARAHAAQVVSNDQGPQADVKAVQAIVRESSQSTALTGKQTVGWDSALEPRGLQQAKWIAETLSPMFPRLDGWQGCLAIIMCGREMGLGVMSSLMNFDIVEGKPSPKWQVIVAFAMQHPDCEYFRLVHSDDQGARFVAKRKGDPEVPMAFTIEDAKRAGLVKPSSGWNRYPAALCRKMCAVHLSRVVFPDSKASGLYCPEELAA